MQQANKQNLSYAGAGFYNIKREKRNSIINRCGMCPAVKQRAHGMLKGDVMTPLDIPSFCSFRMMGTTEKTQGV